MISIKQMIDKAEAFLQWSYDSYDRGILATDSDDEQHAFRLAMLDAKRAYSIVDAALAFLPHDGRGKKPRNWKRLIKLAGDAERHIERCSRATNG